MLSVFILLLSGILLAATQAHLKPETLTAPLGQAHLVEDVLWVKYPHSPLVAFPNRLHSIFKQVTGALEQLVNELPADVELSGHLLHLLFARIAFVNETLTLALENYADVHLSSRPKRGLIYGLGHLSRYLFGTDMDADVEELREKYTYLSNLAKEQNKVISLDSQNIARLDRKLQDVANYTNILRASLNTVLQSMNSLYAFEVLEQALAALETSAQSILNTNNQIIQNLVDASRGRVTSSLFPFQDLRRVLHVGGI